MQCLETMGSSISTYLITSYFIPPLASVDTNSLINCILSLLISSISLAFHASHYFLFHLITSYFTLPLLSMDKNITHHKCCSKRVLWKMLSGIGKLWVLFAWNQFPPFLTDTREFYPCPTYFSMILDLSMMIKRNDNMEWYIWHIDMS
jgi:hypothetical protein